MATLREDVTDEILEKARQTARERKGFVLYHDNLKALKVLPAEQFKTLIYALETYSITGEQETFEDPALCMAYAFCVSNLDRNAESYAAACANRSAARKSAESKKQNTKKKEGNLGALEGL